jgi:PAS domain S-box-containing protein
MTETATSLPDDRVYRLLVDAVIDYAVFLLDPDGRIRTWNPGAERIKGYTAGEAIGQHYAIFFTEEDRLGGLPRKALEAALRDGRFESEGWRLRKDGTRFWALAVVDAVHDEAGRLIGFAKITRDMTERHRAQQALLDSERSFRLLVQGVTDYALFMLDPNGFVASWNAGARRIKGYAASEIIGQHFSRFYTEEDRADGAPARALAEARETGRFEAEAWRVRKDGSRFWANVVIDAIHDGGELVGFAKITRDLTERQEAQRSLEEMREQLAQSQKLEALGQLTGGVAHDFNNLLQVISGGIALAEKLPPGDPRLDKIFAEMRSTAAHGASLTRQLLAFSRRAPMRPQVVDTAKTIEEAVSLFSRVLGGGIRLEMQLEEALWPVRIDSAHFEVALLNLAVNARDAMPDGGTLSISARNVTLDNRPQGLSGAFVAISMRDTGVGIPDEVLGRIFEPFFTTKPVGKGTGLGLSQVYGFAQQAGGTVTIDTRVDEGTEFTLLLPAALQAEADNARLPLQGEGLVPPLPEGLRILVVDDHAAVGRLTVGMLEGSGHHPVATTDPGQALRWLSEGQVFDLIITDVIMPGGMSGLALAREVRRRWPALPVLLVTGYTRDGHLAQREFPVLHKPFTALELALAMRSLFQRRQPMPHPG